MSRFFAFVEGLTCKPSTWSNCLSSSFEMPLSLSISVVARITYSLVVIRFLYFIYILIFYLNTFFFIQNMKLSLSEMSHWSFNFKSHLLTILKKKSWAHVWELGFFASLYWVSILHMNHYGALFPNPTPNHLSTNYSHREIKRKERWLGIR